ncbi:hypothetical protein HK101_004456, partial [Irineochytrium annulatum]
MVKMSACAHDPCEVGGPLVGGCDGSAGCVWEVVARDYMCGIVGWDEACVMEIERYCGIGCGLSRRSWWELSDGSKVGWDVPQSQPVVVKYDNGQA